jgi:DNA polymerase
MNSRRKRILNEIGLTPIWKIKTDPSHCASVVKIIETNPNELINAPLKGHATSIGISNNNPVDQMNWHQLKLAVSECIDCPLHQTRKNTVFGVGDEKADWLFVGEGPGAREDEIGEPFVGQAGKLLDQMLAAIQLKRNDGVYIANIVKCRPPYNRNPASTEVNACEPYLRRQIKLIAPKLIIALGKVAAENLLGRSDSLGSLRGKVHYYSGIPLVVTYHPAYLLRALPEKARAWKDLCFAKALMQSLAK